MELQQPGRSSSPISRNPSGKHVRSGQRKIIINVYKALIQERPSMKYREIMSTLSEQTGIGISTVKKTIAEYVSTGKVSSPNKKRNKKSIMQKLSEQEKTGIRHKVHEFWSRREVPNLNKVLSAVNADPELGTYVRTTFHRILHDLRFKFTAIHRNSALMEQEYIVLWRHNYLIKLSQYRAEGRHIYYLGETWVDSSISTSTPEPTGTGNQLVALHIGSVDGFVPGGFLCFKSEKTPKGPHDKMNGNTFLEWFQGILPSLKEGAVIVMDNAPYHSVKTEHCPTMAWTKPRIVEWLVSKGYPIPPQSIKVKLIDMVKKIKPEYDKYVIDEYAKRNGRLILRLAPYHSELNPIEMVWAMVKNYVKMKNTTQKLADVKKLISDGIDRVSVEIWQTFIRHTTSKEQKLFELGQIIDEVSDANMTHGGTDESDTDSSEEWEQNV